MFSEDTSRSTENAPEAEPLYFEPHPPGRPLTIVQDADGNRWLCDKEVDPTGDLREQGCWRCDEVAFPMGGR